MLPWLRVIYHAGTVSIDVNATPELLLEQNIKLAEKLSSQNKVGMLMGCCLVFHCNNNVVYHNIALLTA